MLGRHAGQCKITVYAYKVCRHELNLVGLARPSRQLGKTVRYDRLPQRQRIAGNAASVERNRMRNPYQRCLPGGLRRDGPAATAANRGIYCQCGKGIGWETATERLVKGEYSSAPPSSGASAGHASASSSGRCRRKWHIIVTFWYSRPSAPVRRCFCRRNECMCHGSCDVRNFRAE